MNALKPSGIFEQKFVDLAHSVTPPNMDSQFTEPMTTSEDAKLTC